MNSLKTNLRHILKIIVGGGDHIVGLCRLLNLSGSLHLWLGLLATCSLYGKLVITKSKTFVCFKNFDLIIWKPFKMYLFEHFVFQGWAIHKKFLNWVPLRFIKVDLENLVIKAFLIWNLQVNLSILEGVPLEPARNKLFLESGTHLLPSLCWKYLQATQIMGLLNYIHLNAVLSIDVALFVNMAYVNIDNLHDWHPVNNCQNQWAFSIERVPIHFLFQLR